MIKSKIVKKILSDDERKLRKDGSPRKRFRRRKDEEILTHSVHIGLTNVQKKFIEEKALQKNQRISDYLRSLIDRELNNPTL